MRRSIMILLSLSMRPLHRRLARTSSFIATSEVSEARGYMGSNCWRAALGSDAKLPMEFAVEAQKLLSVSLEGSADRSS